MNSIALILPFFGRLPNYFEFFLQSVGNNPDVDLLLFTDDKTNFNYPVNVKRHYITFLEFKKEIQSSFEFDLKHLKSPYNLCDFKPAYGFALQKYLLGYDFWGHCDCDLIFGKLRAFLTDNILNQYDKVYAGGSLSLYRNTTKVNARFMEKCTGFLYYKDVYTASSRLILCYDEWGPGWGVNRLWNDRYPERCYWRYEHDDVNPMFGDFRPTQNKRGECICYHYRDDGSLVRVFINEQGRKEETKKKPYREEVTAVYAFGAGFVLRVKA